MCLDTSEPICFKLGMMLFATELHSLIPVWITLIVTQGHRVMGKLEFKHSFLSKIAWSNWNVGDGSLCKGDNCEEVLYL